MPQKTSSLIDADLAAARAALDAGKPAQAITPLSRVIAVAPLRADVLALFDRLAAVPGDPLTFVPATGKVSFGVAALRAYLLGKLGRQAEGYQILRRLAVSERERQNGLIDWALPWLEQGKLDQAERLQAVTLFLTTLAVRFPGVVVHDPEQAAILQRWLPHGRGVEQMLLVNSDLKLIYSDFLRKAGLTDEALTLVREEHTPRAPRVATAVALADGCWAASDLDGWHSAAQEVLGLQPEDAGIRLDLGDRLWEHVGQAEEAERWYAEVVEREPQHPWALPSLYALRHQRTGERTWRERLEEYAVLNPNNDRARMMLERITPWVSSVERPTDTSVNVFDQMVEKLREAKGQASGKVILRTEGIEAPSNLVALRLQMRVWGHKVEVAQQVQDIQKPDPRKPRTEVRHLLWEYDGTTARPQLGPPPAEVTEVVGRLAQQHYQLRRWSRIAAELARGLGSGYRKGLLGVMVHPPEPPKNLLAWEWLPRVQVAAALVLGHLDVGWEGSLRRRVLFDLANGPLDWSVVAAVAALTATALEEPALTGDVATLLGDLRLNLPHPGEAWYAKAIINCQLRLPGLTAEARRGLLASLREMEEEETAAERGLSLMAQSFLEKRVPPGVIEDTLARGLLSAYVAKSELLSSPQYLKVLPVCLKLADQMARGTTGEAAKYYTEQHTILKGIQKELSK